MPEPHLEFERLLESAESIFRQAELSIVDGTYFPTDPTKEKIPLKIREHNKSVKRQNFKSAKKQIESIKRTYIIKARLKVSYLDEKGKKQTAKGRYRIEELIHACDSYINILK